MSFGFSVSDIYGCARLAYVLYDEFKQAPGACQGFAQELLLFHRVLLKTESTIKCETSHLSNSDQAALEACLASCKELLYVHIIGSPEVPDEIEVDGIELEISFREYHYRLNRLYPNLFPRLFQDLSQRIRERKFASRIPKLQRAISAHIEKLTAFNVLIIQSCQSGIQDSQESMKECLEESHDLLVKSSADHALQLDSLSARLETSQTRIEAQLQSILANQQRSNTLIISHSLNASSPEGRQTWMELGRLLRNEGITPDMIQKNRALLVNTMKSALKNETPLAGSVPESYVTAPEYHVDNGFTSSVTQRGKASHLGLPSVSSQVSLFGSAPPRSAGFTDAFLEKQNGAASSLDQEQNVDDGMQSLLQGMSHAESIGEYQKDETLIDFDEVEDFVLEDVPIYNERRQSHNVEHGVDPVVPRLRSGESTRNLKEDNSNINFEARDRNLIEPIRRRGVDNGKHREHAAEELLMSRYQVW